MLMAFQVRSLTTTACNEFTCFSHTVANDLQLNAAGVGGVALQHSESSPSGQGWQDNQGGKLQNGAWDHDNRRSTRKDTAFHGFHQPGSFHQMQQVRLAH